MQPMFRVKICGVTNVDDARVVARAGADAVGLNFYPKSPRYIPPDKAGPIVDALPAGMVKVGLFVNTDIERVCEVFDRLGLDMIQLHGDELPLHITQLVGRPVMRAFRVNDQTELHPITDYLRRCHELRSVPQMILADSLVPGVYGGTGTLADWEVLQEYPTEDYHPPLALAGGLTPQNVVAAIEAVAPAAVDVASGVESSPGQKDPAKVAAFVRAANQAFQRTASDP